MGQKTHPRGFRLSVSEDWRSRWFATPKDYSRIVLEDVKIRRFLEKNAGRTGLHAVEIEREAEKVRISLQVSRPGVVIGRGGSGLNQLREELNRLTGKKVELIVAEVKVPELSAKIMAEEIVRQIRQRLPLRRTLNSLAERMVGRGAKGVKIICAGVLGGPSSIARREKVVKGALPGQTLRAKIDFARATAFMTYGTVGVKVWIYLGEAEENRYVAA